MIGALFGFIVGLIAVAAFIVAGLIVIGRAPSKEEVEAERRRLERQAEWRRKVEGRGKR